ncbi:MULTISPECIES: hypothetical protein [unclassified Amycolatopsis]|uniref:hypothetical protein n=1 Tax=unclassified Amycolatopsis TaxID=2618356 RepID=UPI00287501E1|nr:MULTISPECIES: hypothetical protein [unclassified Amycolatopsis]MDS0137036.1 hypothetical protein [Amycolatopsis sp. 505]MDS0143701.1 hypothetical protein [Amycolatopsis sp. CM201R]
MGRHYRDEEPVPHPQDRTPRVPAEGRSEASGAFRTPGRSSISDAFGIARVPGESSGSVFFTEGAQAPGFPPDGPATRRGEASGAYPAASGPATRRGEASGSYPVAGGDSAVTHAPRRGEASGAHPVTSSEITTTIATRRGEASGAYPVTESAATATRSRRGEASGAYPVTNPARRGEASGSYPAADSATRSQRRGEATGAAGSATRTPRRGEATGAHPVTDTTRSRRGEASGAYPVTEGEARPAGTTSRSRRGEASGAYPVTNGEASGAETTSRSRRKDRGAPVPDRVETPASGRPTRASRRAEATGAHPVAAPGEAASPRSRRRGGKAPAESAAERTEVITRPDEDVATRPDDTGTDVSGPHTPGRGERTESTGPQRAGRGDSTGPNRTARSEGTGSHRIVGKSDATGSHRIVGKKAPRRRIATWPIACLVLAVLIGLGVVGWNWADNELNSRAEAQAASCDGGTTHMRVVVTPSVQKPVAAAADRWNQAATVVHGQCVHVMIEAKPSAQVLDALVGRAKLDSIGGLPAAWLPESSYWVSELTTKKPEMIGSPAQSVANARSADYPFIGLAGPGVDDTALRAAQTFREYLEQPAQQADFAAAGIKST